jgi:hypothetical protein
MYKSTGFLAKEYSVTNETIQNWIKEAKFEKVKKTKGGHYRVWVEEPSITILYARVSSSKQKSSLVKQEELLRKKYPDARFISDRGSSFCAQKLEPRSLPRDLTRIDEDIEPFWNSLSMAIHYTLWQPLKYESPEAGLPLSSGLSNYRVGESNFWKCELRVE